MVWKPKERELSEEEAIEQAIKDLRPSWLHCEPQFAVVFEGEGQDDQPLGEARLFPLDKNFRARRWLIFFFDPTSYLDRSTHQHLRDLVKRYAQQAVTPLVVLPEKPDFLLELPRLDHFLRSLKADWALVSDTGSRIAKAFGVTQSPTLILLDRGTVATVSAGLEGIRNFESNLQSYLWKLEPGLSMYPVLPVEGVLRQELLRVDFATQGPGPLKFSKSPGELVQGAYRIADPTITVTLQSPTPEMGLVLAPGVAEKVSHVVIESNGMPIYDSYYGEDLRMDDEGRTGFVVNEPKLYRATRGLPETFRNLTIRFPGADKMPLLWYGFRAAQPLAKT